jgi:hypothetical protein
MKARSIGIIVTILSLTFGSLTAGVIPGRWEKVDRLPLGKPIILTLKTKDRIAGAFQRSDAKTLEVVDPSGEERSIPKSEVKEIVSGEKTQDGLGNGALIGMGVGLGVALAMLAVAASKEGYVLPSAKWGAPLLGIGVGLGAGLAIDASRQSREVLYVAP